MRSRVTPWTFSSGVSYPIPIQSALMGACGHLEGTTTAPQKMRRENIIKQLFLSRLNDTEDNILAEMIDPSSLKVKDFKERSEYPATNVNLQVLV